MIRRATAFASAAFASAALAACPAAGAETRLFHSDEWGVGLRYPADMRIGTDFKPNYFDRGAWRISYAAGTGPGTKIVAVSLPDLAIGDATTTAELRIGASRDPDVVASCASYGMNSGNNVEETSRQLDGVSFTEVPDNSDGESTRSIRTDDLRAVHKGACYAIDLVLFAGGTGGKPPAFPDADIARLKDVLATIRFD